MPSTAAVRPAPAAELCGKDLGAAIFMPGLKGFLNPVKGQEAVMSALFSVSFDTIVLSAITCLALREVFVLTLPDSIAGPGGWFIDTSVD